MFRRMFYSFNTVTQNWSKVVIQNVKNIIIIINIFLLVIYVKLICKNENCESTSYKKLNKLKMPINYILFYSSLFNPYVLKYQHSRLRFLITLLIIFICSELLDILSKNFAIKYNKQVKKLQVLYIGVLWLLQA